MKALMVSCLVNHWISCQIFFNITLMKIILFCHHREGVKVQGVPKKRVKQFKVIFLTLYVEL